LPSKPGLTDHQTREQTDNTEFVNSIRWFDGLERRLEGRDWIACADFTIADILLATVLRDIRKTDLLAPYPCLTAYYARALARPAWWHTLSLYAKQLGVEIADIQ